MSISLYCDTPKQLYAVFITQKIELVFLFMMTISRKQQTQAHTFNLTYNDCINTDTKRESVWQQSADVARAPAYLHCSVRAHGKEFCSLLHSLKRCCVVWDYLLPPSLFLSAAGCRSPTSAKSSLSLSVCLTH